MTTLVSANAPRFVLQWSDINPNDITTTGSSGSSLLNGTKSIGAFYYCTDSGSPFIMDENLYLQRYIIKTS